MKRLTVLCGCLALALGPGAAFADFTPIGGPVEGNSWAQGFNESGVGPFDFMAVDMLAGGSFESPTFTSFSVDGWTNNPSGGPTLAAASGPSATTDVTFNIWFAGSSANPLTFNFYAFSGSSLKEAVKAAWSGSGWSFNVFTSTIKKADLLARLDLPVAAPVPPAVILGFLGFVALRRKLRRLV